VLKINITSTSTTTAFTTHRTLEQNVNPPTETSWVYLIYYFFLNIFYYIFLYTTYFLYIKLLLLVDCYCSLYIWTFLILQIVWISNESIKEWVLFVFSILDSVRYSLQATSSSSLFRVDSATGYLTTAVKLNTSVNPAVILLNMLATSTSLRIGYTQVKNIKH